jgi:hypothetical protein
MTSDRPTTGRRIRAIPSWGREALGPRGLSRVLLVWAATAAVTSATKITGAVRGIAGVTGDDQVAARITGTPGHLTAATIRDPAGSSSLTRRCSRTRRWRPGCSPA